MTELPPEANALLEKARRDHNPTADDAERIRRSLHARLGIAAALAPSMLPTQAAASAAKVLGGTAKGGTLWFGLKAKVLLAVVTLSGVASVPLLMRSDVTPRGSPSPPRCAPHCNEAREREVANVAPREAPIAALVEPAPSAEALRPDARAERRARRHERREQRAAEAQSRSRREPHREDGALQPESGGASLAQPADTLVVRTAPGAVEAPETPTASSTPVHEDTSGDHIEAHGAEAPRAPPELALIRSALTSLRDGAPQRALSLLGTHAAHYPEGAFASERRGLRIVALCASGRLDEGLRERVVFLRREGSAPVAERVRHACQEAPGK